jgi:methylenetetrahydrofolate dehydrogenase (NADP+) / methenyltetrahydrofolate cyclohydrolase
LNTDENINGYIVQLPLPKHISENNIIQAIDPRKDIDGFHPVNQGNIVV